MNTLFAVCLATLYGLLLRLTFGFLGNFMDIMSVSFLILSPLIIGFLTIYLIPKAKTTSAFSAFFKPWITSMAILIITILFNIEGSICWIMIYPLFSILAGIGGIIAYRIRRQNPGEQPPDILDDPNSFKVSLLLLFPAFVGILEGDRTQSPLDLFISKDVVIQASASEVWHELTHIDTIETNNNKLSFATLMGFPRHLETTLDTLAVGGKRKAIYENGLYFDETIAAFKPEKTLVLDIKTDPNHIPPTVMDEHILIGGKHIDILQDCYTLDEISKNSCRLTLSSRFYINTPFNWYAAIWAKYLMGEILQGELDLIERRAAAN